MGETLAQPSFISLVEITANRHSVCHTTSQSLLKSLRGSGMRHQG